MSASRTALGHAPDMESPVPAPAHALAPARPPSRLRRLFHSHAATRTYSKPDSFAELCACGAFRYRQVFLQWTPWYAPERLLSMLEAFSSSSNGRLWDDLGLERPWSPGTSPSPRLTLADIKKSRTPESEAARLARSRHVSEWPDFYF